VSDTRLPLPEGHDGLDVTNERIRSAHSVMSVDWLGKDEDVHFVYLKATRRRLEAQR
jgi:hypothetical protein